MVESERLILNRKSITLIVKRVAIFNFCSNQFTEGFPPPALSVDVGLSPLLQLLLKAR